MHIILSTIWFAITYLFVKLSWGQFPYFLFTFLRFFVPSLILLLVVLVQKRWMECLKVKGLHTHLLRAFAVTVAQFSIFFYLSRGTLLNATMLLNTGPLFIPLVAWLFLGHPISRSTVICLLIAFVGMIFILQPGPDLFSILSLVGILAGLGQACSQVIYAVHSKQESTEVNLFLLYALCSCISIVPLLISYFVYGFELPLYHQLLDSLEILPIVFLLIVSIANVLNQYFRGLAYYRGDRPETLASFLYLTILFAAIFDWTIFHHTPNLYSVLGAIFIIGSGLLKVFAHTKGQKPGPKVY